MNREYFPAGNSFPSIFTFLSNSIVVASFAQQCGMELHYIDRSTYRRRREKDFITSLQEKHGNFYLIPEGGTNYFAVKGCSEIVKNISIDFDYILTACGTGGTIAGLICGLGGKKNVIGIPVLKGAQFFN